MDMRKYDCRCVNRDVISSETCCAEQTRTRLDRKSIANDCIRTGCVEEDEVICIPFFPLPQSMNEKSAPGRLPGGRCQVADISGNG